MITQTSRVLEISCLLSALGLATACGTNDAESKFRSTYATSVTIGGDGSDDGGQTCEPTQSFDVEARRSLFETNEDVLASFSMQEVLTALSVNAGIAANPTALHDQLMDTFSEAPGAGTGAHCDDGVAFDGGPGLNGYPLQCPRPEGQQVGNLDEWFPIAAVNRFDLAPSDGANCGEARLVFANNASIGPSRNFVIFEAKIPNPNPGCGISACAPVQEFWAELSENENPFKRGKALRSAFLDGTPALEKAGFGPFVTSSAFGFGAGQIRTNSFNGFPWTLREFKSVAVFLKGSADAVMAEGGGLPQSFIRIVPVPVAANPFGQLWNENISLPESKLCFDAIVGTVEHLMVNDPNLMGVSMPVECLAAESPNNGDMNYPSQLVADGKLAGAIDQRIQELEPGSQLRAVHIARRALFAGGCMGCHLQSNFQPNNDLGDGEIAPRSLNFVHTSESNREDCGDGSNDCFEISDALKDSFLPHRKAVMDAFLNDGPCCDPGGAVEPAINPDPPIDGDSLDVKSMLEAEQAAKALMSPVTIAGQPTTRAH